MTRFPDALTDAGPAATPSELVSPATFWRTKDALLRRNLQVLTIQDPWVGGWLFPGEAQLLLILASILPHDATVVEIGSFTGRSSRYLLAGCFHSDSYLVCIDPFHGEGPGEPTDFAQQQRLEYPQGTRSIFNQNLRLSGLGDYPKLLIYQLGSGTVAKHWPTAIRSGLHNDGPKILPGKVDLLFIDGNHSQCQEDVDAWTPLLHEHGMICLHDVDSTGRYGINGPDNTAARMAQKGWQLYAGRDLTRAFTRSPEWWRTAQEGAQDRGYDPSGATFATGVSGRMEPATNGPVPQHDGRGDETPSLG
jgi:hypothetical protein